MNTNAAENWQVEDPAAAPDLATYLSGGEGLDLVVEMAHDLRSPLTSILFLAEAMQGGQAGPVTDAQRRQLGLIRSAALCLCTAASDVLEFARGSSRLADAAAAPFSIRDVFAGVRDLMAPLAEEKRLDLRFVAPEVDQRIGHERPLSRVLLNLTANALKFTERGSVEVTAREKSATRIEFSVRDTGPGIDLESIHALYQPFRRNVANPRLHFSSSGLGLAICRRLAAAMGSRLRVRTRPGRGTRFSFELDLPPVPRVA